MNGLIALVGRRDQDVSKVAEPAFQALRARGHDVQVVLNEFRVQAAFVGPQRRALQVYDSDLAAVVGELRLARPLKAELASSTSDAAADAREMARALAGGINKASMEMLQGDFSALVVRRDKEIIAVRDRFGVKPAYYARVDFGAVFSTNLALFELSKLLRSPVNERSIARFVTGLHPAAGETYLSQIQRLEPGCWVDLGQPSASPVSYWTFKCPPVADARTSNVEFAPAFLGAVRSRIAEPAATIGFLSGGLDSSSICVTAARVLNEESRSPLKTISMVFDDTPECNEREQIEAVVEKGGLQAVFIPRDDFAPLESFQVLLEEQGELFLAPGLALSRALYVEAAALGAHAVLDGHGGDEVVSYGWGRLEELARNSEWAALAREVAGVAQPYGKSPTWMFVVYFLSYGPLSRLMRLLFKVAGKLQLRASPTSQMLLADTMIESFSKDPKVEIAGTTATEVAQREHVEDILSPAQPYALEVLHRAAQAHNLEPLYPFWDAELISASLGLPSREKLLGGLSRRHLRVTMKGLLPDPVRLRKDKMNFTPHLTLGLLRHHQPLLDSVIKDDVEEIGRFFNMHELRRRYAFMGRMGAQTPGEVVHSVWRAAALALWLRHRREIV